MDQAQVDRLVVFNELETGPLHRVLFDFENEEFLVVILNYLQPNQIVETFVQTCSSLAGQRFAKVNDLYEAHANKRLELEIVEDKLPPLSAWTLATDGEKIIVPTKDLKSNDIDGSKFVPVGMIVTGKASIKQVIKQVRFLRKDEPTPFVTDQYGDSYNESFYKEPRIIESVPATVIKVVGDLLDIGKARFQSQDFSIAFKKYQKAFHYLHSYYPEHLEPDLLKTLTGYKIRALLNLALTANKLQDYRKAIEAANFVLEMPETTTQPSTLAKAYYQLGTAELGLGDELRAQQHYEMSYANQQDLATKNAIALCQKRAASRRAKQKNALLNAFSTKN
ncbi:Peptidyl-prolyl cis-trans isomerase D [Wickerhamiella sorbophila]|uniref:peptidylprolyl isomerase n=1 Tax=Wickerhamiella sorbophila TaxID=45607 RepID=A0A2T0FGC0_9ASCO|nr:Peptidyl-prolyl cis-trans isomerase D [Wickerhamiella sorbophila]PRT54036.1 Peptidyl-prolyl cis-trans isomerase D [Wickerhamiella sorbophila]